MSTVILYVVKDSGATYFHVIVICFLEMARDWLLRFLGCDVQRCHRDINIIIISCAKNNSFEW